MIKVFDGKSSLRRNLYQVIAVPRTCSQEYLLLSALRAFHITRDPSVNLKTYNIINCINIFNIRHFT